MDSSIHVKDPCLLCTKRYPHHLALEPSNVSYVEPRVAERMEKMMVGMVKTTVVAKTCAAMTKTAVAKNKGGENVTAAATMIAAVTSTAVMGTMTVVATKTIGLGTMIWDCSCWMCTKRAQARLLRQHEGNNEDADGCGKSQPDVRCDVKLGVVRH
jgi:hypothetical protein